MSVKVKAALACGMLPALLLAGATSVAGARFHPACARLGPSVATDPTWTDFNGDSFADLAIGAPNDDVSGVSRAGVVHVLYGGSSGIRTSGDQVWHQNSPGIADNAEVGDQFGSAVAVGDYNDDGFGDVAIGVPNEDVGSVVDLGAVHLLLGSSNGLTAAGSQLWTNDIAGATSRSRFGSSLLGLDTWDAADTPQHPCQDGHAEFAIGAPGFDRGRGAVRIIGDSVRRTLRGTQLGERFGTSLAGGTLGGEKAGIPDTGHATDLVIGAPMRDVGGRVDAGAVHVIIELDPASRQILIEGSGVMKNSASAGDHFGAAVAAADVRAPAGDEIIIGSPGDDEGGRSNAGIIHVIRWNVDQTKPVADRTYDLDTPNVSGSRAAGDLFGTALAAGDVGNPSGTDGGDVLVGIPGRNLPGKQDVGSVAVLSIGANGAVAASRLIGQDSPGISETARAGDRFGSVLSSSDLDHDGRSDVAVGVPAKDIAGFADAGEVHVLYGGASTLFNDARDRVIHQNTSGIAEAAQQGDRFGFAIR